MDPYRFNRFYFSNSQLYMAEHLEHHVTNQTRKDYLSFRGKNKICLLPKYPRVNDLEKHIACLDVILSDWENCITPFRKEIENMEGQVNYLLSYDDQLNGKIRCLLDRLRPHRRRLDDYKVTGEYKILCFFLFFPFTLQITPKSFQTIYFQQCLSQNDFVEIRIPWNVNYRPKNIFLNRCFFRTAISTTIIHLAYGLTC